MKTEHEALHEQALEIAKRYHRAESELIEILQKLDDHKVFLKLGFPSLFDYAIKALKLSEASASNFITVARKSKAVPELKLAIDQGKITVSKARKITPVLTVENKDHWLALAQELPKQKLEKEIAKANPLLAVQERAQYISEDRIKLTIGISEEILMLLKRVQDLESQRTKKSASFEESLKAALQTYLQKKDPVEKAKMARLRAEETRLGNAFDAQASVPGHTKSHSKTAVRRAPANIPFVRSAITQKLKNEIFFRDGGQCTHKDQYNNRCENSRWVEVHHKIPISQGGTNQLANLTTLCWGHHRFLHAKKQVSIQ